MTSHQVNSGLAPPEKGRNQRDHPVDQREGAVKQHQGHEGKSGPGKGEHPEHDGGDAAEQQQPPPLASACGIGRGVSVRRVWTWRSPHGSGAGRTRHRRPEIAWVSTAGGTGGKDSGLIRISGRDSGLSQKADSRRWNCWGFLPIGSPVRPSHERGVSDDSQVPHYVRVSLAHPCLSQPWLPRCGSTPRRSWRRPRVPCSEKRDVLRTRSGP